MTKQGGWVATAEEFMSAPNESMEKLFQLTNEAVMKVCRVIFRIICGQDLLGYNPRSDISHTRAALMPAADIFGIAR